MVRCCLLCASLLCARRNTDMNPYTINYDLEEEPSFSGIVIWRGNDGKVTPLMFPLNDTNSHIQIHGNHTLVGKASSLELPITESLRALGACKLTFTTGEDNGDKSKGKKQSLDNTDNCHPPIEYAPAGSSVESYVYTAFVPLSPTVGIVCHHAFRTLQTGAKLVSVQVKLSPMPESDFSLTANEGFVTGEILDPAVLLHEIDTANPFSWPEYHDYQFVRVSEGLTFPSYFVPAVIRNLSVTEFKNSVPSALLCMGFAMPPEYNKPLDWLENFPKDFNKRVLPDSKFANIKDVRKVKDQAVLRDLLQARMEFIQYVINHMCISLGEYSDHEKIEEHEVKRGMFRAKVSLWPGLSGGPAIPMAQNFVENRLFIGMASGGYTHEVDNYFTSVNNVGFATGYKLFVLPSFENQIPPTATAYLDQFRGLVNSMPELLERVEDRRRRAEEGEEVSDED